MLPKLILGIVLFLSVENEVRGKEAVFVINGKKSINVYDDKFLSFSVDLNTLLKGASNGSNAFVRNLNPAFVRVLDFYDQLPFSSNASLTKWKLMQQWFHDSQVIPIFSVNKAATQKAWDPKDLIPFLDLNEELGYSCYWEMVYDCAYKSLNNYKKHLTMLKYVLDMYPSPKIISSNLRHCRNSDGGMVANAVKDFEGIVDAYMWDSFSTRHDFIPAQTPTWIATPSTKRTGFQSALQWAKQIGEAAKNSYNVAFWTGNFYDIFSDTPVFWLSFLHKKVIGDTVLDIRTTNAVTTDVDVTAYCARETPKQGAMVVSIVNNGNQEFIGSVKLADNHLKIIAVQKYLLTSDNDAFTYLNGVKLTESVLRGDFIEPELENVEVDAFLSLTVPAQTIAIFVLPDAKLPACNPTGEITPRFNIETSQKDEIVGNSATSNDFRRFLVNKTKPPKKNDKISKLEIIFAERPLKDKMAPNKARHIELQLTNEEIKKILLDRAIARAAENNMKLTNKQLEMQMTKAAKKMVKNDNTNKQKYKRFAVNPKRRLKNSKRRNRRDTNGEENVDYENFREVYADLSSAKPHEENFQEEVLKSGEKYLDERILFTNQPDEVDSVVEEPYEDFHEYFERFVDEEGVSQDRIKRNTVNETDFPSDDVLKNITKWQHRFTQPLPKIDAQDLELPPDEVLKNITRWQNRFTQPLPKLNHHKDRVKRQDPNQVNRNQEKPSNNVLTSFRRFQNRFEQPLPQMKRRFNNDVLSSRMNKWMEKMENRKRMSDWIRARQKRSLLNRNEMHAPKARDVKKISKDFRLSKIKPSRSIRHLEERELIKSFPSLKRKQRRPRNVPIDISENIIDDHVLNKIPKRKFYESTSSLPTVVSTSDEPTNNDETTNFISTIVATTPTADIPDETTMTGYYNNNSSSSTTPSANTLYEEQNFKQVEPSNTQDVMTEDKIFFNGIVDSVKNFIESVYAKISTYFIN